MAGQATACRSPARQQDSLNVQSHRPLRPCPVTLDGGHRAALRDRRAAVLLNHAHRPQQLSHPTVFTGPASREPGRAPAHECTAGPARVPGADLLAHGLALRRRPCASCRAASGAVRGLSVSVPPARQRFCRPRHTASRARSGSSLPRPSDFTAETPLHLRMRRRDARIGPHPPALRQRCATDHATRVPLPPRSPRPCHPISAEVGVDHIPFTHPLPHRYLSAPTSTLPHSGSPPHPLLLRPLSVLAPVPTPPFKPLHPLNRSLHPLPLLPVSPASHRLHFRV